MDEDTIIHLKQSVFNELLKSDCGYGDSSAFTCDECTITHIDQVVNRCYDCHPKTEAEILAEKVEFEEQIAKNKLMSAKKLVNTKLKVDIYLKQREQGLNKCSSPTGDMRKYMRQNNLVPS
jgi:hypothetical protein